MPRAEVEFRAGRQMLATKTRQGGMAKRRRPLDSVAASALPAPAQKASSPSLARTCVRSRDHGRTTARARVCTHSRICACSRTCVHTCTHIRAAATAAPAPAPAPNVARICTCSRTYICAAATAAKGPRCPLYRRTHLHKIATGREVKFNFLRIWPLLANNPRS